MITYILLKSTSLLSMVIQLVQELDTLIEAHWSALGFCTRYQLKIVTFYIVYLMFMSLASVVVKVVDSHLCELGSSPGQGNHVYVIL